MHSRELYDSLLSALKLEVNDSEKHAIIRWLLEDRCGLTAVDLMKGKEVSHSPDQFVEELKRLNAGEPLQHILGHAVFYGRRFMVNKSVLIPRPETELLVRHVVRELGSDFSGTLVDIGTGSGCIAITMSLEMPQCTIKATDVHLDALALANKNARSLGVFVDFLSNNILRDELPYYNVDVVISNPPYIRESEKKSMARNVLDYEPHVALFVPDNDPLIFHRTIAQKASQALKPGGLLVMEVNEALWLEAKVVVAQSGFVQVNAHKDLDGKNRFVTARMLE